MKRLFCGIFSVLLLFSLLTGCGAKTPALPEKPTQGSSKVTLAAVGDICMTDAMLTALHRVDGSYDFLSLFGDTANTIAAADLRREKESRSFRPRGAVR